MAIANSDIRRSLPNFLPIPSQGKSDPPPTPKYPPKVALEDSFDLHLEKCVSKSSFGVKPSGALYGSWKDGQNERAFSYNHFDENNDSVNKKALGGSILPRQVDNRLQRTNS